MLRQALLGFDQLWRLSRGELSYGLFGRGLLWRLCWGLAM